MFVSKISSNIHAFHSILTQYSFFSGRYADFARQLTLCNFGVYAMDWIGNLIFIMYTFEILILHIIIFVSGLKLFVLLLQVMEVAMDYMVMFLLLIKWLQTQ